MPFLVFGWFVRGGFRQRLEEQVVSVFLTGQAEWVAERLESRLEQFHRDCSAMKWPAGRALDKIDKRYVFVDHVEFTPGFNESFHLVMLVDAKGNVKEVVQSLGMDGPTEAARARLEPTNVADQDWFKRSVADVGEFEWVGRHLSPFTHSNPGKVSRNPEDYSLGLALSIEGDDGVAGVVYALIRWKPMQDIVDEATSYLAGASRFESAKSFVCDENGVVLAHSNRGDYSADLRPEAFRDDVISMLGSTVVPFVSSDQSEHTAAVALVDSVSRFDWICGVYVSNFELFASSREFGTLLISVTVLVALVLVGWSLFASRRILKPVRELAEATAQVAHGDLSARVETAGRDELADLGRAFNHMAEDLSTNREQLRNAERQAAWAEMARQVAHEIKNPLTPMKMSAQLLLKAQREASPRLPELIERVGRTVIEQTDALTRIASDFSQFAGPPDRTVERLAADDILKLVEHHFHAVVEAGVDLRFEPNADGVEVRVDRQELRRVLLNLVQNALNSAGEEGSVRVESACDGSRYLISVIDDGPGVPEDVRGRLFEPYFTTRSSGTGLGLAICQRILEAHGGAIALAKSEPGCTEFRFELPVVSPDGHG